MQGSKVINLQWKCCIKLLLSSWLTVGFPLKFSKCLWNKVLPQPSDIPKKAAVLKLVSGLSVSFSLLAPFLYALHNIGHCWRNVFKTTSTAVRKLLKKDSPISKGIISSKFRILKCTRAAKRHVWILLIHMLNVSASDVCMLYFPRCMTLPLARFPETVHGRIGSKRVRLPYLWFSGKHVGRTVSVTLVWFLVSLLSMTSRCPSSSSLVWLSRNS